MYSFAILEHKQMRWQPLMSRKAVAGLTLYLIEKPFNTSANIADTALVRAT